MRQIILDTETTGLDPKDGHRIIEIGCIELINRKFTGNNFHIYLNPEREIDLGALNVHGISNEFLKDKPKFRDIAKSFIDYIDNAEIIIHNAPFDVGFINSEFKNIAHKSRLEDHCIILDTLLLAREKHKGQRNSLDALCKRYNVNNSNRKFHGALLDAELLAFVYLSMTGGQAELFADSQQELVENVTVSEQVIESLVSKSPVIYPTAEELNSHNQFVETFLS